MLLGQLGWLAAGLLDLYGHHLGGLAVGGYVDLAEGALPNALSDFPSPGNNSAGLRTGARRRRGSTTASQLCSEPARELIQAAVAAPRG